VQRCSTPLKSQPLFGVKGVRGVCWQVHRASAEGLVCLGSAAGVSENFSSGCARCTGVHACAQQRLLCGPVTQAQHCDRGNTCAQGGCGLRRSGQAPCRACAARQQERGADAGRAGGGERLEERRGPVLGAPADQVPGAACGRDLVLVAPPERCLRQHCGLTSFCPLLTPKVQGCVPGVLFLLAVCVTQARQRTERPAGCSRAGHACRAWCTPGCGTTWRCWPCTLRWAASGRTTSTGALARRCSRPARCRACLTWWSRSRHVHMHAQACHEACSSPPQDPAP